MQAQYPSPEEIMAEPLPEYGHDVVNLLTMWKRTYFDKQWRSLDKINKLSAIVTLIKALEMVYCYKVDIMHGDHYAYYPRLRAIEIDSEHPSILSTLHEFGHHLYGASELEACRFSVHLFRQVFPKQYEKLEWRGHTLVKKKEAA